MFKTKNFFLACLAGLAGLCAALEAPTPESDLDLYLQTHKPPVSQVIDVPPLDFKDIPDFTPVKFSDLPEFKQDLETHCTKSGKVHDCGLLCTINFDQFPHRKLDGERKMFVPRALSEFKEDLEVRTFWQAGKAPLAVTLLGFGQASDDRNARAWQYDLYRAGNHVLSFDSLIRNNMNRAIGNGVAGNILEEGRLTARIINAFLNTRDPETGVTIRERVSSVRLLGASYGGNIALQTMREPSSTLWPLDRVLVISTPVDFEKTMLLFDKYYREDRSKFGKLSLARLLNGFTPHDDDPSEKELSLMRAGIGYSFHGDFASIAKDNVERYMPDLRRRLKELDESQEYENHRREQLEVLKNYYDQKKKEIQELKDQIDRNEYNSLKDEFDARYNNQKDYVKKKMDDPSHWTFNSYIHLCCRPYWEAKGDYTDYGRLKKLMAGAPNFVQLVIAEDDPLNNPEDVIQLKEAVKEPQLLLIPHGGHLGYTGTQWFQALMGKFFGK